MARGVARVVAVVALPVIGRMFADDIDYRHPRASGIVKIRQGIRQSRSQVQQRRRRFVGHTCIAIGSARDHAFEQAEYAAHACDPIDSRDELHLGSARVHETDFDPAMHQGVQQAFSAIHHHSIAMQREGEGAGCYSRMPENETGSAIITRQTITDTSISIS